MKKFLAILLAITIAAFVNINVFAAEELTFSDVSASTAEGTAIYKLAKAGIVHGNGDGTFAPGNSVSRAELCKMVNLIFKYTQPAESGFLDVTPNQWYYNQVLIGKQAGYINGFEDGTFRGDDPVTREQACAIIFRVSGLYDLGFTTQISDEVSDWAQNYVKVVLSNRLMQLEANNTFRATQNMKRGELAVVLANFLTQAPDTPSTPIVTPGGAGSSKPSGGGSGSGGGTTVTSYTVTVTQTEGGKISPETKKYDKNASAEYTITPDADYEITNVFVNGISVGAVSSYRFDKIVSNATISAVFSKKGVVPEATYTIVVTQTEGGTISPDTKKYDKNASAEYAITPDSDYEIADVLINGTSVGKISVYKFDKIVSDAAISALFSKKGTAPEITYTVTVTQSAGGTISPETQSYNKDSAVELMITPDIGYEVADVLVNGISVGKVTTYKIDSIAANATISAVFAKKEMTKEEIIETNQEVLSYLKNINTELSNAYFTGKNRKIVNIVKECVTSTVALGESGEKLITKDFVYDNYDEKIQEAKDIYHSMEESSQAAFIDSVTSQVSKETLDYLQAFFL